MKSLLFLMLSLNSLIFLAQNAPADSWEKHQDLKASDWDVIEAYKYSRYIIDSSNVTGLMIIHKGKVVFDYGDLTENSYIASCRKSVLSMLYGKYVENGTIDLDNSIADLNIDDVEGILPVEKSATIKDIISARSGIFHPEGYPGGMQQFAPERGSVKPGSYWLYSNWDFNVAGYIFESETGKNIYDEIETQLAEPLQMQDWKRDLQQKAGDTSISKYLAYPMWFSTRDMARLGQLMLNKGNWNGRQIISENWIDEMLKQRTTFEEINKNVPVFRDAPFHFGYSYMWWLFENNPDPKFTNAYMASGAMGQAIVVLPEIETVLVYKTKAAYRRVNSSDVRLNLIKKGIDLYHPKWQEKYLTSSTVKPINLTNDQLDKFVGIYRSPEVGFKIELENNTLRIRIPNGKYIDLIPVKENHFVLKDDYIFQDFYTDIRFVVDENSLVTGLVCNRFNGEIPKTDEE